MGRRLRRADRDPNDTFEPKEKCVDIALATSMLYLAAIPYAYDIAIAVIGDRDFMPMLQNVRRLGKRVAIASKRESCAPEFSDPLDEARVKDFDIIWLDDLLHKLERKFERHQITCESPFHRGNRTVWTTHYARKAQKVYCDDCRQESARQRAEAQRQYVSTEPEETNGGQPDQSFAFQSQSTGKIKTIVKNKPFGFITASTGLEYFFHQSDLAPGL